MLKKPRPSVINLRGLTWAYNWAELDSIYQLVISTPSHSSLAAKPPNSSSWPPRSLVPSALAAPHLGPLAAAEPVWCHSRPSPSFSRACCRVWHRPTHCACTCMHTLANCPQPEHRRSMLKWNQECHPCTH